jgi:hypothetical protein
MLEDPLSSRLLDELAQALQASGASIDAARMTLGRHVNLPCDITQGIEDAAGQMARACEAFHRLRGK